MVLWRVALFHPDAEVEDKERVEVDLLEPEDGTFPKMRAEDERVAPSDGADQGC
jgi:hypothetical protein